MHSTPSTQNVHRQLAHGGAHLSKRADRTLRTTWALRGPPRGASALSLIPEFEGTPRALKKFQGWASGEWERSWKELPLLEAWGLRLEDGCTDAHFVQIR